MWRHKICQAAAGFAGLFFCLLAQAMPCEHSSFTRLIGIQSNVIVVDAVGRVQAHHTMRRDPSAFNDFLQHLLSIVENFLRFNAYYFVFQDGGVRAGQIPSLKERTPIDVARQFGQIEILENTATNEFRCGCFEGSPINRRFVATRFGQWPHGRLFFVGMHLTHFGVIGIELVHVCGGVVRQQALRHTHTSGGIGHIDHRAFVVRCNFDSGMHTAGGGAPNQQRHFAQTEMRIFLHFAGHVLHLFQAGCNQP